MYRTSGGVAGTWPGSRLKGQGHKIWFG